MYRNNKVQFRVEHAYLLCESRTIVTKRALFMWLLHATAMRRVRAKSYVNILNPLLYVPKEYKRHSEFRIDL